MLKFVVGCTVVFGLFYSRLALSHFPVEWVSIVITGGAGLYFGYAIILHKLVGYTTVTEGDSPWGLHQLWGETSSVPGVPGISIVFVHGLASNPTLTWTVKLPNSAPGAERHNWIGRDLLPAISARLEQTTKARLRAYCFNYESKWMAFASQDRLRTYGERLQEELQKILDEQDESIILVGHSLGGLVIKQALTLPSPRKGLQSNKFGGIIFLGTPHHGTGIALLGLLIALAYSPFHSSLGVVRSIRTNSQALQDLHEDFIIQYGGIPIRNFYESDSVKFNVGSVPITSVYVVPKESATFIHQGTINRSMKAGHSDLNKLDSKGSNYRQFLEAISAFLEPGVTAAESSVYVSTTQSFLLINNQPSKNPALDQEFLSFFDNSDDMKRLEKNFQATDRARHPSTCLWIGEKGSEIHWLVSQLESSLLWISGSIGSGKTTLCTYISKYLTSIHYPEQVLILYAFCGLDFLQSETQILRMLVQQLLARVPEVRRRVSYPQNPVPDAAWLWVLLRLLLIQARTINVYLMIDGIDVLPPSTLEDLMAGFQEHITDDKTIKTKLILTSRPTEFVRAQIMAFRDARRIRTETALHIGIDIQIFLERELARISSFRGWSQSTNNRVLANLIQASNGMFLYASFAIKRLEYCPISEVINSLKEGFGDLDGLYDSAMNSIAPSVRSRQSNILLCLLYTKRRLNLTDLYGVFAPQVLVNTPEARKGLVHDILLYSPLIQCDPKDEYVDFVHSSAKAYIDKLANTIPLQHPLFLPTRQKGHNVLAEGCLQYIISKNHMEFPMYWHNDVYRRRQEILARYPGLEYAFQFWLAHSREALQYETNIDASPVLRLLKNLDRLRTDGRGTESFWRMLLAQSLNPRQMGELESYIIKLRLLTSTEFFAFCGLPSVVEDSLRKDSTGDSQALALQKQERSVNLSIQSGCHQTLDILLTHYSIKSMANVQFCNALSDAAWTGNPELVRRVMHFRPFQELSMRDIGEALYAGISNNDKSTIDAILQRDKNIDILHEKDKKTGMTALHWIFAARQTTNQPPTELVNLVNTAIFLVRRGADINARDCLDNTILHYVSYSSVMGQTFLVRRLIEEGANPELANYFGWLPIHLLAGRCRNLHAIRYLDRRYPQSLFQVTNGKSTVLHWATQRTVLRETLERGTGQILRYLLIRGQNLNAADRRGVTPLQTFQSNRYLAFALWEACQSETNFFAREQTLLLEFNSDHQVGNLNDSYVLVEGYEEDIDNLQDASPTHFESQQRLLEPVPALWYEDDATPLYNDKEEDEEDDATTFKRRPDRFDRF